MKALFDTIKRGAILIAADVVQEVQKRKADNEALRQQRAAEEQEANQRKSEEAARKRQEIIDRMHPVERLARGLPTPIFKTDLNATKEYQARVAERDSILRARDSLGALADCCTIGIDTGFDQREQAAKVLALRLALHGVDVSVVAEKVGWPVDETRSFLQSKNVI